MRLGSNIWGIPLSFRSRLTLNYWLHVVPFKNVGLWIKQWRFVEVVCCFCCSLYEQTESLPNFRLSPRLYETLQFFGFLPFLFSYIPLLLLNRLIGIRVSWLTTCCHQFFPPGQSYRNTLGCLYGMNQPLWCSPPHKELKISRKQTWT